MNRRIEKFSRVGGAFALLAVAACSTMSAKESAVRAQRTEDRKVAYFDAEAEEADGEPMVEQGIEGSVEGGVVGGTVGGEVGPVNAMPFTPSAAPAPPPKQPMAGSGGGAMGFGAGGLGVIGGKSRPAGKPERGPRPDPVTTGDRFAASKPNPFTETAKDALSTFAIDVDTASYTVARRYLNNGQLPPQSAVRVEEYVNYFKYQYPAPERGAFSVHLEGAPSPFTQGRQLLKIGLQGKTVSRSERMPTHLVFLVDTSGSMSSEDKLPLAREAIKVAVRNLNENDTVAITTYAGGVRDVLAPTPAGSWQRIFAAVDTLESGGGTAMGTGMELAYKHAVKKAAQGVVSRVVVLTDGDTNIGPNLSADSMLETIGKYVKEGVTLSTIGFGMGNYRDDLMERLANKGNGNCFYIDSFKEAKKVFEQKLAGTLEVIAKDVKIQVAFNPEVVKRYRLVGYENRDIADRDFRNDKVDAGEIGAGHSVTALYEVELTGAKADLAQVHVRAKTPHGTVAAEQTFKFGRERFASSLEAASPDLRFATAVAGTADILRGSEDSKTWSLAVAEKLAAGATKGDPEREEFVELLKKARRLMDGAREVAARR